MQKKKEEEKHNSIINTGQNSPVIKYIKYILEVEIKGLQIK